MTLEWFIRTFWTIMGLAIIVLGFALAIIIKCFLEVFA